MKEKFDGRISQEKESNQTMFQRVSEMIGTAATKKKENPENSELEEFCPYGRTYSF